MRIGNIILDTDNMTSDDITVLIRELRDIRARKVRLEELQKEMTELLNKAAELNCQYYIESSGIILEPSNIKIYETSTY